MEIIPPAQWYGHKLTHITEVAPGEYETTSMTGFTPKKDGTKRFTRVFKDPGIAAPIKKIHDERLAVATDEVKQEAARILALGIGERVEAKRRAEEAEWEAQRPLRQKAAYVEKAIF